MPKTLADLRTTNAHRPGARRPERSLTVCLAPDLVAEVQTLTSLIDDLAVPATLNEEGKRSGPPRRKGQGQAPELLEAREQLRDKLAEMAEYEGELRIRATLDDGEWRRWCDEHPAREESEPGHQYDLVVTGGFCNADDLIETLGTFVATWNGEDLGEGDWATIFEPNIGQADKKDIAGRIVGMYERRLDFQQWRNNLSASLLKSSSSGLLGISVSPTSGSTAGKPAPSSGATT